MTIDTSAVLAILLDEPEREEFIALIENADRRLISTAAVLEASMVLQSRRGIDAAVDLDFFLREARVQEVSFDHDQLAWARVAYRRFGKGIHPAALNFGDCLGYALAQSSGEPLLFKGADFAATDIPRVR